jgi:hypothetical protein
MEVYGGDSGPLPSPFILWLNGGSAERLACSTPSVSGCAPGDLASNLSKSDREPVDRRGPRPLYSR